MQKSYFAEAAEAELQPHRQDMSPSPFAQMLNALPGLLPGRLSLPGLHLLPGRLSLPGLHLLRICQY